MGDTFSTTKKILEKEAAEKDKEEEQRRKEKEPTDIPEEANKLAWHTHFSMQQVVALHEDFKKIAAESPNPTEVTKEQFYEIIKRHGVAKGENGPYVDRLFHVFDNNESGTMNFKEFILGLSVVTRGSAAEKFRLSFDIYDADKSGSIAKEEMRQMLVRLNQFALQHDTAVQSPRSKDAKTDEDVEALVEQVFDAGDVTGNGKLTFAEYFKACQKLPWLVSFDVPNK